MVGQTLWVVWFLASLPAVHTELSLLCRVERVQL